MRTNIDIDDDLMAKALSAGPFKTKKEAVEAGLKLLPLVHQVLVVDSSVWIDFFANSPQPGVAVLSQLLDHGEVRIVVPDLVLFEVLRGFHAERDYRQARQLLETLHFEVTAGVAVAHAASQHYRSLRARGITVASAIDVLLASFCIENDYALLHRDRHFDHFESQRGLRVWPL